MSAPGVVLVVGDVIDDVIVRPAGPVRSDTDTPAAIARVPGGSGANQAAWLAHAGARTRFVGRVGAADVARHTAVLAASGVEAVLAGDPRRPTGTIVIVVEGDARTMLTDRGANLGLTSADLPDVLLEDVSVLLISGYALFDAGVRAAVTGLARRARTRGAAVVVDPSSAGFIADVGPAVLLGWLGDLGGVDLLLPNADEARLLTGGTATGVADAADAADAAAALRAHAVTVVVKLGADGAVVATADGVTAVPAVAATVVDPTGAGDAFAAGLLAALTSGADVVAAAHAGAVLAAHAVARTGARPPAASDQPAGSGGGR